MAKKRPNIIHKDVIGLDEIHNGFHINKEYNSNLPMLISGYLVRNCVGGCSQSGSKKYTRKKGAFNPKGKLSIEELRNRATYFLAEHPDFFYMTLNQKEYLEDPIKTRALAMATISLKFFEEYSLSESKTIICIDQANGREFSENLCWHFREYLKIGNLFVKDYPEKTYTQEKADERNLACKLADRTAYYTLALKFRTPHANWPYQRRRLQDKDFLDLAVKRNA